MKTVEELQDLAACTGGFIIRADHYSFQDLFQIASHSGTRKICVILRNADRFTQDELQKLARQSNGTFIFNFSEL